MPKNSCIMQIWAESGKSALPICNYSQILYQFLTFTQNLKRSLGVILKAMCYYPVSVHWGKWIEQPTPEQVTKIIDTILESHSGDVNILFTSKDVLLQFGWDCLNISIYNPDEEMCMLFEKIAASEGLFWRKSA